MHLLQEAGFDVRDWSKGFRGKSPAANPRLCYNWSYVQPGERVAICLWHDKLQTDAKRIFRYQGPRRPTGMSPRSEAIWKRRSDQMLADLRLAYEQQLPLTAIMLEGVQFTKAAPKASRVKKRLLDRVDWAVVEFDFKTGKCLLVRGASPVEAEHDSSDITASWFEGQQRWRYVLHRRREDRARRDVIVEALRRNKGSLICEVPRCGFDFKKRYGALGEGFAEVHHLDPLSRAPKKGRSVNLKRLVIVCANCHRMIHVDGKSRELKDLIP